MFGISGEHLIIFGIVLLIFGPRRLPELGHTMGKAIRNFKDSIAGVEEANFRHLGQENAKPGQLAQSQSAAAPVNSAAAAPAQPAAAPANTPTA